MFHEGNPSLVAMADSEPIVTQTSTTGYESTIYSSTGFEDVKMSVTSVAGAVTNENLGDSVSNTALTTAEEVNADMHTLNAIANGSDSDASQHVLDTNNTTAVNEKLSGNEGAADASMTSASDVSLNGGNTDMGGIPSVVGTENGIISNDASGMSLSLYIFYYL